MQSESTSFASLQVCIYIEQCVYAIFQHHRLFDASLGLVFPAGVILIRIIRMLTMETSYEFCARHVTETANRSSALPQFSNFPAAAIAAGAAAAAAAAFCLPCLCRTDSYTMINSIINSMINSIINSVRCVTPRTFAARLEQFPSPPNFIEFQSGRFPGSPADARLPMPIGRGRHKK